MIIDIYSIYGSTICQCYRSLWNLYSFAADLYGISMASTDSIYDNYGSYQIFQSLLMDCKNILYCGCYCAHC